MLIEFKDVRQIEGEAKRRWFTDDYFDLIIWYDDKESVNGFQLCYDKTENERALTWMKDTGFTHDKIDAGDVPGRAKMTPILAADGIFARDDILKRFQEASGKIDRELALFVYDKIKDYPV
jgi:hypothetical protein